MTWDSFIFQFERIAHNREWSKKEKLNYFLDCLSEKALDYARKIKHKKKYRKLKKKMAERFDIKADPSVICKEMFSVKLDSNETLEEFAQRVQFMAMDAHPGAKEETIQQISVEVFLRGLPDKEAARSSSDKCPKTIQKALKYVKNAINTQKAIFNKPSIPHHQVSFAELDEPDLSVRSTSETEATKSSSFQKRSLDTIMMEQELAHLRAKISQLESQQNSSDRPSRPFSHPVTPPPLTRTNTPPRNPS